MANTKVKEIVERWEAKESFLIEMLQDVQDEYNYLPQEVLADLAEQLDIPMSRIYHIATFYKAFSLRPRGKYVVNVCMGTACHVKGGPRVLEAVERDLRIKTEETTEDMQFSLDTVRCLGCCGLAAVMMVGKDIHGNVAPAKVSKILKEYRKMSKASETELESSQLPSSGK